MRLTGVWHPAGIGALLAFLGPPAQGADGHHCADDEQQVCAERPTKAMPAQDVLGSSGTNIHPFQPKDKPNQISTINQRSPVSPDCSRQNAQADWPDTIDDPSRMLSEKLLTAGATNPGILIVELDRELLAASFHLLVRKGVLQASRLQQFRDYADKHIFVRQTRVFAVIHAFEDPVWLGGPGEPKLLTERSGSARLVRMSMDMGLGLAPATAGMLRFEDFVCEGDTGYAIVLPGVTTERRSSTDLTFQFRPMGSAFAVLGPLLADNVPAPTSLELHNGSDTRYGYTSRISASPGIDWDLVLGFAQVAIGLVGLVLPFL